MKKKIQFASIAEYHVGAPTHPRFGNLKTSYLMSVRDTKGGRKNRHVAFRRVELNHRGQEVVLDGWVPVTSLDPEAVYEALVKAKAENMEERPSLRASLVQVARDHGQALHFRATSSTPDLTKIVQRFGAARNRIVQDNKM